MLPSLVPPRAEVERSLNCQEMMTKGGEGGAKGLELLHLRVLTMTSSLWSSLRICCADLRFSGFLFVFHQLAKLYQNML
jgi:hypothetical protein